MTPAKTIIYDFGANNGDDVPYYLKKADLVVAIEAIPALCQRMSARFSSEIGANRLVIENCALVDSDREAEVPFYISRKCDVLSCFSEPAPEERADFTKIMVPAKTAPEIVARYGPPFYIKIDLEGYDKVILDALFRSGICPPYISAEAHNLEVFLSLVGSGHYRAFKLLDGRTVGSRYRNCEIKTRNGVERYSFPRHSAGPFGNDIVGDWMSADCLLRVLGVEGPGWKDIHATRESVAMVSGGSPFKKYLLRIVLRKAGRVLRSAAHLPDGH